MDIALQILQIIVGSGLIIAIYNNYSQVRLQNKLKLTEITETKYRSILIYMDIMLHPEQIVHTPEINNPMLKKLDIHDTAALKEFYRQLIEANKANLYLYANDKLINAVNTFLKNPKEENYIAVAKQMHRALWK